MRLTFDREKLLVAMKKLAPMIGRIAGTSPVSRSVMVRPLVTEQAVVSSIGETFAAAVVDGSAKREGTVDRFLMNHRIVTEIIGECPDETVVLEPLSSGAVRVVGANSSFEVHTHGTVEQFDNLTPALARERPDDPQEHCVIDAGVFVTAAERVAYACPPDGSRGVLIEIEDGRLRMIATDGRRVAVASAQTLGGGLRTNRDVMIPASFVTAARKVLPAEGAITFAAVGASVVVWVDETIVCSSECAGRFPEWKKVVPGSGEPLRALAGDFTRAIKQAIAVTDKEDSDRITLAVSGGNVTLSAGAGAHSRIRMPANVGKKVEYTVGLTPKFLTQPLAQINPSEEVELVYAKDKSKLTYGDDFYYVLAHLVEAKE